MTSAVGTSRPANCRCCDHQEVAALSARYAQCLDGRNWEGLADVFTVDVTATYGGRDVRGRGELTTWIRAFLDGCGASQHLLGFASANFDGDRGTCETQVRVIHEGAGERAALVPYEAIGSYRDQLVRTPAGWRIAHRTFDVRIQSGDVAVLTP